MPKEGLIMKKIIIFFKILKTRIDILNAEAEQFILNRWDPALPHLFILHLFRLVGVTGHMLFILLWSS